MYSSEFEPASDAARFALEEKAIREPSGVIDGAPVKPQTVEVCCVSAVLSALIVKNSMLPSALPPVRFPRLLKATRVASPEIVGKNEPSVSERLDEVRTVRPVPAAVIFQIST